ncbi:hypothetical protein [Actinomadura macrotermitis]|nr:hypothetical protein [Actinomadura macrotermitis]
MTDDEIRAFTGRLHQIAISPSAASRQTRHTAETILKEHGLWSPQAP